MHMLSISQRLGIDLAADALANAVKTHKNTEGQVHEAQHSNIMSPGKLLVNMPAIDSVGGVLQCHGLPAWLRPLPCCDQSHKCAHPPAPVQSSLAAAQTQAPQQQPCTSSAA